MAPPKPRCGLLRGFLCRWFYWGLAFAVMHRKVPWG